MVARQNRSGSARRKAHSGRGANELPHRVTAGYNERKPNALHDISGGSPEM